MNNKRQIDQFLEKDKSIPFSKRVLTFIELYSRYNQIVIQLSTENVGKKELYNLLLELEVIKTSINNMLPDYKYPAKKQN